MSAGWTEVPLFTVDNYGVSSTELAHVARERMRARLIAEGRMAAKVSRARRGLPQQVVLDI